MEQILFPHNLPCLHDLPIPRSFWTFPFCDLPCQVREQTALLNFYKTTNGNNWKKARSWRNTSVFHCHWHGVVCDNRTGHVIALNLPYNNVSGIWSGLFGDLTHFMGLCLRGNKVMASFEEILSTLHSEYLIRVSLSFNNIHGVVPWNHIYKYKEILQLEMGGNRKICGELPPNIGLLKNLHWLELGETNISGGIPESFALLKELRYIDFTSLQLTGNLNIFLTMHKLTHLRLSQNHLYGHIPDKINISVPNLRELHLHHNKLRGVIPDSIGYLPYLEYLNLAGNAITGFVPSSIRLLTKLESFIISWTNIKGFQEGGYFNSPHFARFLAWRSKKLNCSFERLMQILGRTKPSLRMINMEESQLHGRLTSEIFTFTQLYSFDFTSCQLTGVLPEPITGTSTTQRLTKIVLLGNRLWGNIPSSYSTLKTLYLLDLRQMKQMHGDIDDLFRADYKITMKRSFNTTYSCPALTFRHNSGSVYIDSSYYYGKYCFCNKGYYGIGSTCKQCMAGGVCKGYNLQNLKRRQKIQVLETRMILRAGYWPFESWENVNSLIQCSNFSLQSRFCNPTGACVCSARVNFKEGFNRTVCNQSCICAMGHTGRFCSQCLPGRFRTGAMCVTCPKRINWKKQVALIICSISALSLLLSVTVALSRKRNKLALAFAIINILAACLLAFYKIIPVCITQINVMILLFSFGWLFDSCRGLLKISVFYIQIMDSLIASINIWPKTAYELHYYVSGPFNFQFDSLSCYIPKLFTVTAHLAAILIFPVVAILVIWIVYSLAYIFAFRKLHNTKTNFKLKCKYYNLLVLDFSYFPIVKKVFSILPPCQKMGEISFMKNFVSVDCGKRTHKTLLALAGLAVPFYIVGIPYLIFLPILYMNRRKLKLDDNYTSSWLGSFYQLYKPEYRVYVKPLMMTLRLMIAMALAIIPMESVLQTIFIVTILLTAIILETHAKPYVRYHHLKREYAEDLFHERTSNKIGLENAFEITTLSVMLLTFILARFYLTASDVKMKRILIWTITIINFSLITALMVAILARSMMKPETSLENNHVYMLYDEPRTSDSIAYENLLIHDQ